MNAIRHIRKAVLQATQQEMADIAGVSQAAISRWESGHGEPELTHLQRIRGEVIKRGQPWDDALFFGHVEAAE